MINQNDNYYVLGNDGLKRGPATLATLSSWTNEGRVLASTIIFDEAGNEYTAAQLLPGLFGSHPHVDPHTHTIVQPGQNPNSPGMGNQNQYPGQQIVQGNNPAANQNPAGPPTPGAYVPPPEYNSLDQNIFPSGSGINGPYGPGYPRNSGFSGWMGRGFGRYGGYGGYGGGSGLGWLLALFFCCNVMFAVFGVIFAHGYYLSGRRGGKLALYLGYTNFAMQIGLSCWWKIHHGNWL